LNPSEIQGGRTENPRRSSDSLRIFNCFSEKGKLFIGGVFRSSQQNFTKARGFAPAGFWLVE
jgi:hypothetical protein